MLELVDRYKTRRQAVSRGTTHTYRREAVGCSKPFVGATAPCPLAGNGIAADWRWAQRKSNPAAGRRRCGRSASLRMLPQLEQGLWARYNPAWRARLTTGSEQIRSPGAERDEMDTPSRSRDIAQIAASLPLRAGWGACHRPESRSLYLDLRQSALRSTLRNRTQHRSASTAPAPCCSVGLSPGARQRSRQVAAHLALKHHSQLPCRPP